jgi:hypothetical protein
VRAVLRCHYVDDCALRQLGGDGERAGRGRKRSSRVLLQFHLVVPWLGESSGAAVAVLTLFRVLSVLGLSSHLRGECATLRFV